MEQLLKFELILRDKGLHSLTTLHSFSRFIINVEQNLFNEPACFLSISRADFLTIKTGSGINSFSSTRSALNSAIYFTFTIHFPLLGIFAAQWKGEKGPEAPCSYVLFRFQDIFLITKKFIVSVEKTKGKYAIQ